MVDESFEYSSLSSPTMPMAPTSATGTGFGSKLMKALIERKWNGAVTVDEESSFTLTIEISLSD
ncbi:MAG: hypothetical protein Q8K28_04550 [Hoeflea sp.]|uniref:hypothetical protein n=1 Tax=Hoeflea sp. TaxID=1940281 RepID=UPI00272EEE45|nr:hypothetical protein [Hoeflea sp.]MDP2119153.1 hypothetical protein [Hoeflea sp.]